MVIQPRRTERPPLRLAIIGCGAAAEHCHVPALPTVPTVKLVALVDPVAERAQKLSDVYRDLGGDAASLHIASTIDDVVDAIDIAIVSAPHARHAEIVVALARRRVHCLVEKPMALSTADCDRMMAAARAHGVVLGLAFVRRLFPASVWVKRMITEGACGDIVSIRWGEGSEYDWPLVTPSLFVPQLAGGGVLADAGPHVLDLVLWWLNADAAAVVAYRDTSLGGVEAEAVVQLVVRDVKVTVELSRLRSLRNTCTVEGTARIIDVGIDVEAPYFLSDERGVVIEKGTVGATFPAQSEWELLFAEQLRNFAAAVRGGESVYANANDGRRITEVIRECYASREPILLPWRTVAL